MKPVHPVHPVHPVRWFTIILICQSRNNKNPGNISLDLRKFVVFAFYLFGSGLSRLSEAFYTQFKNDYKGTLPAGNFRLYHKNENHLISINL